MEQRIHYKKKAVLIVGLSWMILSGILFYFCYIAINLLALYIILSLVTFVIHVTMGFALKSPRLLTKSVVFYPFGIVVAQVLNEISSRWYYTSENTIVSFAVLNWLVLFILYMAFSASAFGVLRLVIGYETVLPNPISSYSYHIESGDEPPIESIRDYIGLFENVSLKTNKQKKVTWMTFETSPNRYVIAFVPKDNKVAEVDLFAYRMRSDTVVEADKEKADTIASMLNAFLAVRKKQGYVNDWQIEKTPEHSEELKEALLEEYTTAARFPIRIPSLQQVKYDLMIYLGKNKKQIITIVITAIVSPLLVHFLISSLLS